MCHDYVKLLFKRATSVSDAVSWIINHRPELKDKLKKAGIILPGNFKIPEERLRQSPATLQRDRDAATTLIYREARRTFDGKQHIPRQFLSADGGDSQPAPTDIKALQPEPQESELLITDNRAQENLTNVMVADNNDEIQTAVRAESQPKAVESTSTDINTQQQTQQEPELPASDGIVIQHAPTDNHIQPQTLKESELQNLVVALHEESSKLPPPINWADINHKIAEHYLRLSGYSIEHFRRSIYFAPPLLQSSQLLSSGKQHVIYGERGLGKTTYLGAFIATQIEQTDYALIPFNQVIAARASKPDDVIRYWIGQVQQTEAITNLNAQDIDKQKIFFVIDDFDKLPRELQKLWATELLNANFITTARNLCPDLSFAAKSQLNPLTTGFLRVAIAEQTNALPPELTGLGVLMIDPVFEGYLGWPLVFDEYRKSLNSATLPLWLDVIGKTLDRFLQLSEIQPDGQAEIKSLLPALASRLRNSQTDTASNALSVARLSNTFSSFNNANETLLKLIEIGLAEVVSTHRDEYHIVQPAIFEAALARGENITPREGLTSSLSRDGYFNFTRWLRLRLEFLVRSNRLPEAMKFLKTCGVPRLDYLSRGWYQVIRVIPPNLFTAQSIPDEIIAVIQEIKIALNAQTQAATWSNYSEASSCANYIDALIKASPQCSSFSRNDEAENFYRGIQQGILSLAKTLNVHTIFKHINKYKTRDEAMMRCAALSLTRRLAPTDTYELSRLFGKRKTFTVTESLLQILVSDDDSDEYGRLCAGTVLTEWGEQRALPALQFLSDTTSPFSINGRVRAQILSLALSGNKAAVQWV
ncbi:hypothetical protein HY772_10470 [Candidatus Woesearchaeota archaeon]|nr:hypothetical protein [Candidatus Woesearchaeota archaeon]